MERQNRSLGSWVHGAYSDDAAVPALPATRSDSIMRRLLTHLAQFSSFSKQGEVLCTQGLTYLLENSDARAALSSFLSGQAGLTVDSDLTWRAEVRQPDGGRPDLEGSSVEGTPVVKVEAKLGAALSEPQLHSYVSHFRPRGGPSLLVVLVPRYRIEEAASVVSAAFAVTGAGPWLLRDGVRCVVTQWDSVLDALSVVTATPYSDDLVQFRAMYRVLIGDDIEPVTNDKEVLAWREREDAFTALVDRATRRLTYPNKVLPMGADEPTNPKSYQRRYVCRRVGAFEPCFSLGVQDPFSGHQTPFWLRFNSTTSMFPMIRDSLMASPLAQRLVNSGGHIWMPLDVLFNADGHEIIDSLVGQTEAILRVAYLPVT